MLAAESGSVNCHSSLKILKFAWCDTDTRVEGYKEARNSRQSLQIRASEKLFHSEQAGSPVDR
jgi:hypothetical protein